MVTWIWSSAPRTNVSGTCAPSGLVTAGSPIFAGSATGIAGERETAGGGVCAGDVLCCAGGVCAQAVQPVTTTPAIRSRDSSGIDLLILVTSENSGLAKSFLVYSIYGQIDPAP